MSPASSSAVRVALVPDHALLRRIGQGAYGEVWLARNAVGTLRAVKIVYRDQFADERPYEREFNGIRKFEPFSRSNEGLVDVLQIGQDDQAGYFYYVMELADDATAGNATTLDTYVPKTLSSELKHRGRLPYNECLELGMSLNLARPLHISIGTGLSIATSNLPTSF